MALTLQVLLPQCCLLLRKSSVSFAEQKATLSKVIGIGWQPETPGLPSLRSVQPRPLDLAKHDLRRTKPCPIYRADTIRLAIESCQRPHRRFALRPRLYLPAPLHQELDHPY